MNKPFPVIQESAEVLQQLRSEREAKKRLRLQALYLIVSGQARTRLVFAQWLAVHRHTIKAWLACYERGGLAA